MTLGDLYELGCCAGLDSRTGEVSDTPSSIAHEQIAALRAQAGRRRMEGDNVLAEQLDSKADAIEKELHQRFLESEGLIPPKHKQHKPYLPKTKARIAAHIKNKSPEDGPEGPQVASAGDVGPGLGAAVAVAALLGIGGYLVNKGA